MRGTITRRGKTWLLKFEGPRINGKRDQRYATVKGTRQAAQKELTRLLSEADTNKLPEATRDTVASYLRTYLDGPHQRVAPDARAVSGISRAAVHPRTSVAPRYAT